MLSSVWIVVMDFVLFLMIKARNQFICQDSSQANGPQLGRHRQNYNSTVDKYLKWQAATC